MVPGAQASEKGVAVCSKLLASASSLVLWGGPAFLQLVPRSGTGTIQRHSFDNFVTKRLGMAKCTNDTAETRIWMRHLMQ